jgi:type IV secretory pathway VirB2 component (pilin)
MRCSRVSSPRRSWRARCPVAAGKPARSGAGFAQANFEGLADNILGLLSNGLLRTLAIIAIIVVGLLWFLGRASVQMLVTVVVGVVIVFSAPWIVDTITG